MAKLATVSRVRSVANPARRANPFAAILGPANPQKEKKPMAQAKKAKKSAKKATARTSTAKRNPQARAFPAHSHKKGKKTAKRRNPSRSRTVSTVTGMLQAALPAIVGLIVTRQLPQVFLKEKNAGVWGYAANIAAALASAWAIGKFWNRSAGNYALIGGGVYTVSRILIERYNPIGKYLALSGLGDFAALGELAPPDNVSFSPSYSAATPADGTMPRALMPPGTATVIQNRITASMPPIPPPNLDGWDMGRMGLAA